MSEVLRRILARPSGAFALLVVVTICTLALLAPVLNLQPPGKINIAHRFEAPSWAHWLGTDHLGRDLLSRLIHGSTVAMGVALSAIALALTLGTLLGIIAAESPNRWERPILIVFDVIASFPSLVLALAFIAVLGPGMWNVALIIAITMIPHFGRVARAQVLTVREQPYIEAERILGASRSRIALMHILPNIMGPLVILASMDIPVVIAIEAGLSFIGLGVRPPLASWGTLIYDGFANINQSTIPVIVSCVALAGATLGFTLLGEALRDAIDPRRRSAR
ncbi:ABC transporter permease [Paracoccus aminophilus]|uniref:ABC-type dipeptide/oligopeptide/nickel transport systems, permease component n=1 Tax=Paracoccus aminophilus JCM 7686 TaxID=1367847 RepID=S5XZB4_PARAH|nr:ABC transporter permease [Paracoccus aminophilus]AGT10627.1 ABC-type dipeptide/oligopeptide/nickel transport systems, permease component [Paracoccus aminophilus JCM 7686]